ncbi:MAG TPA: LuxR C-terminal-related transcriptional regulator [Candidatus Limnocylindrales bacterium]|nr:LuxR C-terminal-related transcriptional regulator [Candidatus Limnocylindrales bacterium]
MLCPEKPHSFFACEVYPLEALGIKGVSTEYVALERGGGFFVDPEQQLEADETTILVLGAIGMTVEEIASHTPYADRTIKRRKPEIYEKLGATNQPHAIQRSFVDGILLVEPPVPDVPVPTTPSLSPRQYEYLIDSSNGLSEATMAARHRLSERTIKRHGAELRQKYDAPNASSCVLLGNLVGILPPTPEDDTEDS